MHTHVPPTPDTHFAALSCLHTPLFPFFIFSLHPPHNTCQCLLQLAVERFVPFFKIADVSPFAYFLFLISLIFIILGGGGGEGFRFRRPRPTSPPPSALHQVSQGDMPLALPCQERGPMHGMAREGLGWQKQPTAEGPPVALHDNNSAPQRRKRNGPSVQPVKHVAPLRAAHTPLIE